MKDTSNVKSMVERIRRRKEDEPVDGIQSYIPATRTTSLALRQLSDSL